MEIEAQMVDMSVYVCWKYSWCGPGAREKAAPGPLGSEPCGRDPASTWCWAGQGQVQLEMVLRVWDVFLGRLCRDNEKGGLLSETLCFTAAGQGRMCCCGVWHAWFSSEVSPGWHDCIWAQAGGWAGRLWAAVLSEEQSWNTGSPSPLAQEMGHEQVLSMQRCRQVRAPVAHQLPCRLTCRMELSAWCQAGSGQQGRVYPGDGQAWWPANLDSIWIMVASVS